MNITADQVRTLWTHGGTIRRGEDYAPITQDDLGALDIDTDDDGTPLPDQWDIIADQLNSAAPGEPANDAQHGILDAIEDIVRRIRDAELERDDIIRQAVAEGIPVISIAERADLSRARIYQIRDGRR